ncbi:S-layer homology domain-containing protein [Paenibacillus sp. FSL P4-0338]|uniref:S-layer homology domain-containing protein n=1 Tax=Paenibacillus sp. FSL P4-0338 TaxID=2921635 RepID=UPI0030F5ADBB
MNKTLIKLALVVTTCSAVVVGSLSLPIGSAYAAETVKLTDVKTDHWAYSTIKWAADKNIVTGYPDGTFRPNKQVSEAEFLMMFIKAYQSVTPTDGQKHWADPVYSVAQNKNWPVRGISTKGGRDVAITRGEVAEIVAAANGVNFMGTDAVKYLLSTGLSSGKTDTTVVGYKATDLLTRAEAVAFIKKAKDAGLSELKDRPTLPSGTELIPATPDKLPESISIIKEKLEAVLTSSNNYENYEVKASDTDLGVVVKGTKKTIVGYSIKSGNPGSNDLVVLFDASSDISIQLTTEMMKAVGISVPSNFTQTVKNAAVSGNATTLTVDGYRIDVIPHPTNADQVSIMLIKQ